MKYQKVLDMAEKFVVLAEQSLTETPVGEKTEYQSPENIQYQIQREQLPAFANYFQSSLRRVRNQMESEIGTLKMRGVEHKVWGALVKVYNDLVELYKEINPTNPYIAGTKLVHMVLDRPNLVLLDNLEFLGKHHLKQTNVDFGTSKRLKHPDIYSIEELKKLAVEVKNYMAEHPLLSQPTVNLPPPNIQENLKDVPAFFAGEEEKTKT